MGRGLPSWVPSPEPRFDAIPKRGSVCGRYRNVRPVGGVATADLRIGIPSPRHPKPIPGPHQLSLENRSGGDVPSPVGIPHRDLAPQRAPPRRGFLWSRPAQSRIRNRPSRDQAPVAPAFGESNDRDLPPAPLAGLGRMTTRTCGNDRATCAARRSAFLANKSSHCDSWERRPPFGIIPVPLD